MKILIGTWCIEPYKKGYGYVIRHKVGTDRWKPQGYFPDLSWAVLAVFDELVRSGTNEEALDACNVATARQCTVQIVNAIEQAKAELREATHNAEAN